MCVRVYGFVYACIYLYVNVDVDVNVYVYVHVNVNVYEYVYVQVSVDLDSSSLEAYMCLTSSCAPAETRVSYPDVSHRV